MNSGKRLLLVAIGLAGGLVAQTGHAGATVYGQLNLSVDGLDNGSTKASNVSSNSSRLGVKGDIQVGGDVAGIYQIESEVNADTGLTSTGTTVLASRDTFVGVQGNFGTVRIGHFDTPVKVIGRQVDLFKDQVGDARNFTRGAGGSSASSTAGVQGKFDERPNNGISYTSPEIYGVKGTVHYATNTDIAAATSPTNGYTGLASVGFSYAQGPSFLGVGYEKDIIATTSTTRDPSVIRVAGYYDLDAWRFNALWQAESGVNKDNSKDEHVYGVGVRYITDAWAFKVQDYQLKTEAANKGASLLAAGAEYALQKGVTLYGDYAVAKNDSAQTLTPYKEGRSDNLTVAAGKSASAISLGLIVKF